MSIFLIKNPEKIKDNHLINIIEKWDVIKQTVSYGYKLFGRGGVVNYKNEVPEAKDYYNLLKFRISKRGEDIEDDAISFSTSIGPCWDLFDDTEEALKIDGFLFNLAQSYDPEKEFFYAVVEKENVYCDDINSDEIKCVGENDKGSNIFIFRLPLSMDQIERLGIKVLSNMIDNQSGKDRKVRLSRILKRKQVEFNRS